MNYSGNIKLSKQTLMELILYSQEFEGFSQVPQGNSSDVSPPLRVIFKLFGLRLLLLFPRIHSYQD